MQTCPSRGLGPKRALHCIDFCTWNGFAGLGWGGENTPPRFCLSSEPLRDSGPEEIVFLYICRNKKSFQNLYIFLKFTQRCLCKQDMVGCLQDCKLVLFSVLSILMFSKQPKVPTAVPLADALTASGLSETYNIYFFKSTKDLVVPMLYIVHINAKI